MFVRNESVSVHLADRYAADKPQLHFLNLAIVTIRLENKNVEIARWSCISSCPCDYNMVAVYKKHAVR